jgi:hypothetical protein
MTIGTTGEINAGRVGLIKYSTKRIKRKSYRSGGIQEDGRECKEQGAATMVAGEDEHIAVLAIDGSGTT